MVKPPAIDPSLKPLDIFPFFTGCQRSGTTLLRVIFNNHPELAIPGESHFIPEFAARRRRYTRHGRVLVEPFLRDVMEHERVRRWKLQRDRLKAALETPPLPNLPDAIRRVYSTYALTKNKPRYGDKTPRYATQISLLAQLFPESRFVHVTRDGRDVALSLLEMPWGPNHIDRGALYWRERVLSARSAGRQLGPERYLEYRHEELIRAPEETVQRICAFLDLSFDVRMLEYHEKRKPSKTHHMRHLAKPPTPGLRDWRGQMCPEDIRIFELLAGDVLRELGYQTVTDESTLDGTTEKRLRRRARALKHRDMIRRSRFLRDASNTLPGRWFITGTSRLLKRADGRLP